MPQASDMRIDASPTKEFFIYMLTKDITLIRSIVDLIDNSWDGSIRHKSDVALNDLWIRVEISKSQFKISDNCGGIPYDIAKQYAFRFGRPKDMPRTDHSVGQFGVGMKRSLFKLGNRFRIESKTPATKFVVEENVTEWVKKEEWEFTFDAVHEYKQQKPLSECGTTIIVTDLHESVSAEFDSEIFITQLKEAIESAHQRSIEQGIAITLNQVSLKAQIAKLFQSAELKPAYRTIMFDESSEAGLTHRF